MWRRARLLLVVAILSLGATPWARAESRVALVIGNSAYQHAPALDNPRNDAEAIAASLNRLGFSVVKGVDLTKSEMEKKIKAFSNQLNGAQVALVYYAGHGLQVSGENYLIPVDAKLEDETDLHFEAVDVSILLELMERQRRTSLVFLDACRDNPFAQNLARSMGAGRSTSLGRGLAITEAGIGTLIAFATQPGNIALDGVATKHSPFTAALLEHIATPGLEIRQMLSRVRGSVIDATGGKQVPWDHSSLTGDFYFVPQPATPSAAPTLEALFWDSIKESRSQSDFQSYLDRFPNGTFVDLARTRLAELKQTAQQPQVATANPEPAPQPPRGTPVTLAVIGPMSGDYSKFGDQLKKAADIAVADINSAGGVLGRPLALTVLDDRCEPGRAESVAQDAVKAGVAAVIGHFCSQASISAAKIYAAKGVVQISPASSNPLLTELGLSSIFRVVPRDDRQGDFAAYYIVKQYSGVPIAIVHDQSSYGVDLAERVKKELANDGVEVALEESYTDRQKDFSGLLSKLKSAGIQVIYLGGFPQAAAAIIRQAWETGYHPQLIGSDGIGTTEFGSLAGEAAHGALMTAEIDASSKPEAAAVVARLRAQGQESTDYELFTYAAVQVWAQATQSAGSLETKKIIAVLKSQSFKTVLGPLAFDAKGDVTSLLFQMYVWNDGAWRPQ